VRNIGGIRRRRPRSSAAGIGFTTAGFARMIERAALGTPAGTLHRMRGTNEQDKALCIDKVNTTKGKTQSEYFMVCLAHRSLKQYEVEALGALACAYKIENPDATDPQVAGSER
jgi:hypothetical protein